ncbi:MAG: anti-sigma factor [Hyphomicrobiales bacterium]|nr:anti-sigma factor [Hyphomicrobiales bacterium]MDE1974370.1 anti-sigma factor [Hyphomicrobiales bacterium]MDE2283210.1 anti-sigma factor [Hyphomicrobiales bacterium]MDE2372734.1 anti-sigma factor [Hyphomicrobiales bacterium]
MNCSEADVLINALVDGELDAGHARDVEAHVASCRDCTGKLASLQAMRSAMAGAGLMEKAPAALRERIERTLPAISIASARMPAVNARPAGPWRINRRVFAGGFAAGTALSAAVAATLLVAVVRDDRDQKIASEVVSAHLRSLQPGHLTDVETSDRHTVKPWFNGKLDVAPPVIDLTAEGFTLIGGRLDTINGETVAALVYRRRHHVINLFVARRPGGKRAGAGSEIWHGFNVRRWTEDGLDFWAVSDINAGELDEFYKKFSTAARPAAPS